MIGFGMFDEGGIGRCVGFLKKGEVVCYPIVCGFPWSDPIPAQGSCTVAAACAPLAGGHKAAVLTAAISQPGALPATAALSAVAIGRGDLDGDGFAGHSDAVTALRVTIGMTTTIDRWVDLDGDGA